MPSKSVVLKYDSKATDIEEVIQRLEREYKKIGETEFVGPDSLKERERTSDIRYGERCGYHHALFVIRELNEKYSPEIISEAVKRHISSLPK